MSFNERFSNRAEAYVAGRPSYPREAIETLFAGLGDPQSLTVADLGAGTGISARAIAAYGAQVIAIEPNRAMREAAEHAVGVTWRDGTAEQTGLADASVDIAAAFQAWHWFANDATIAEARRIVRPGGRIAVVYNERDESDPFTFAYGEVVRRHATDQTEQRRAHAVSAFSTAFAGGTTRRDFVQQHVLDLAGLHARMASSSYLPNSGDAAALLQSDADALFTTYALDGRVPLALVTTVIFATR